MTVRSSQRIRSGAEAAAAVAASRLPEKRTRDSSDNGSSNELQRNGMGGHRKNAARNGRERMEPEDTHENARKKANKRALTSQRTFWTRSPATWQAEDQYRLDDGTILLPNDTVYLVSEPPGEPYYIGRIMEFVYGPIAIKHQRGASGIKDTHRTEQDSLGSDKDGKDNSRKIRGVRVNWFYRPRDIHKHAIDNKLLYATMHNDVCPIHSIRGRCVIKHRDDIDENLDKVYKNRPDHFWFDKLFDRYIHRFYDIVPTDRISNMPERTLHVLQERWQFVIVEGPRGKELTSPFRGCKRCGEWCDIAESVRCITCHSDYHLTCVEPPLPRKPTKGFAWTCESCTRAHNRQVEREREMSGIIADNDNDDQDSSSDEESEPASDRTRTATSAGDATKTELSMDETLNGHSPLTKSLTSLAQITKDESKSEPKQAGVYADMWPYMYFGILCRLEDVYDYNFGNINPRAESRVGPRYQASVADWTGHHIVFIDKKADKRNAGNKRKRLEGTSTPVTESEVEDQPQISSLTPWVQEKPPGYVPRGEDQSSASLIFAKPAHISDEQLDGYLANLKPISDKLKVKSYTPNFIDAALNALVKKDFDFDLAIASLKTLTRKAIKEPTFTEGEVQSFERGVSKFGSDMNEVAKEISTKSVGECVRFYYSWKKSDSGHKIWDNFSGRKHKTRQQEGALPIHGVADDSDASENQEFTKSDNDSAFDSGKAISAGKKFYCKFCNRTKSRIWRKAPVHVGHAKPPPNSKDQIAALCMDCADPWRRYGSITEPKDWGKEMDADVQKTVEKAADKASKESEKSAKAKQAPSRGQRKPKEVVSQELAKQIYYCAVCSTKNEKLDLVICKSCGLKVHKGKKEKLQVMFNQACYGVPNEASESWLCDMCENEANPQASRMYECILCPIRSNDKSRQPLKPTSGNNWVHVVCAIWHQELRFSNVNRLSQVESIGSFDHNKWFDQCSVCGTNNGACVSCNTCHSTFHVCCAFKANFTLAFDIQPVKGSRRDTISVVNFGGETGVMTPAMWCPQHDLRKTIPHAMTELSEDETFTALELYVRTYKQADLALTGSMRKAQIFSTASKFAKKAMKNSTSAGSVDGNILLSVSNAETPRAEKQAQDRNCESCGIDISPLWWPVNTAVQATLDCDQENSSPLWCHKCHIKLQSSTPIAAT